MELDETRIFNAAHLMVASLAGSLAHVTCKVIFHENFRIFFAFWFGLEKVSALFLVTTFS